MFLIMQSVSLFVATIGDGDERFVTGEFDRCVPPSLYLGTINEAMFFDSGEQAQEFLDGFEQEGNVEEYKLVNV